MRAVIYDPDAPANLRLADVAEPLAADSDALVEVRAAALNFGEVHFIDRNRKPGEIPGWDTAGIVVQAAADGSVPPVGSRVPLGRRLRRATCGATSNIAVLRSLGPVVGQRVLVTGASGGVGRLAVQLAARAGAHVIAAVGAPARGAGLLELGAAEVVVGLAQVSEPVFGVLDNVVGGGLLTEAFGLVADGGSAQSIGMASNQPDHDRLRESGPAGARGWNHSLCAPRSARTCALPGRAAGRRPA